MVTTKGCCDIKSIRIYCVEMAIHLHPLSVVASCISKSDFYNYSLAKRSTVLIKSTHQTFLMLRVNWREMIDTDKKYVDNVSLIKFLLMKDVRPVHKRLQNLYEKPFSSVNTLFSTTTQRMISQSGICLSLKKKRVICVEFIYFFQAVISNPLHLKIVKNDFTRCPKKYFSDEAHFATHNGD